MPATAIPYVEYAFSPWRGCQKVSEGCARCFAEAIDRRFWGGKCWGAPGERIHQSNSYWREPIKWNLLAERRRTRPRVLCATMCDPCEDRGDLLEMRRQLERTITATPHLVWLLLSKRPQNYDLFSSDLRHLDNVRLGATIENQARADERLFELCSTPAAGYWVSAEPILGPIRIDAYLDELDLVVCGDEDGPGRRKADIAWVRSLRDACEDRGVPFFFKQWHWDNRKTNVPILDGERHTGRLHGFE